MRLSSLINCDNALGDLEITGVTNDSRRVEKGFAFVCINGAATDGHLYAEKALEKGAAVIITERDLGLANQIISEDTHATYSAMCSRWFGEPSKSMKIIGVTGTNGKTSVSYMLKSVIEHGGHKCGLIGTIQNMVGDEVIAAKNTTPDAYELNELFARMRDAGCAYAVMEVSSHSLAQQRVGSVEFECAMFTNLTQDHLDYHKTMHEYMLAKKRLFTMCKKAILNIDDPCFDELSAGLACKIKTYSVQKAEADYTAGNVAYRSDGVDYDIISAEKSAHISLSTGGRFSVYNSLCAGACAAELGFSLDETAEALSAMRGVKGRAEVVPCDRGFTIIIDYAHTPDGLKNILNTFKECEKNRLTVLFGCGGDRDRTKRPLMGRIAAELADNIIVTSDNPRSERPEAIIEDILAGLKDTDKKYVTITNRVEAIKHAVKTAEKGDIIVLAGKGHETYQILADKTIHLDEREIVQAALAELE